MTNKEIREHIGTAHFDICHAMKELKTINAYTAWQDLLRINRRLQELNDLLEQEEQEDKK